MSANHQTGQLSRDNPGWLGKGIPSLRSLTLGRLPQLLRVLKNGRFRNALNLIRASLADLWNFYGLPRTANRVYCPCCGWRGPAFIATANWRAVSFQSKCPQCDSRSRHRALTQLLPALLKARPAGKILFFAPEKVLLERLNQSGEVVTTDYNSRDVDFPGEDIQHLSLADSSYAMLICNHVLEHVPDDRQALAECARVLCPGGIAAFTIPGEFPAQKTWDFDEPDGNGHYRHYGMDVLDKMRPYFERVQAIDLQTQSDPTWKIRRGDYVFVCVKER